MELKLMLILICALLGVGFLLEISLLLRELIRVVKRVEERLERLEGKNSS
jgi:hypothetical protein